MSPTSKREALNALIDEIFQANGRLLNEGDRLTAEMGLTGARWQVMAALDLESRPLTVAQIARRMGLQRQSVQRLANILVEQGILQYHPNPEHKRARLVAFTGKGRESFTRMDAMQLEWANQVTPRFSAEELEQAAQLLKRLRECLEAAQEKKP